MRRRDFLRQTAALSMARLIGTGAPGLALAFVPAPATAATRRGGGIFVPGYRPGSVYFKGKPAAAQPLLNSALPEEYGGKVTLLTRLGAAGEPVRRALFPIYGHGVSLDAAGRLGFFAGLNFPDMATFDPHSLELGTLAKPHRRYWVGGGHAEFTADGKHLLVTERYPNRPFSGRAEDHYGLVSVRDAVTLKVIDSFSSHGIAPHEINIFDDGRHVAVANYGSTLAPKGQPLSRLPHMVEPCLNIIEISTGRLVDKMGVPGGKTEIRHLAARRADRIFAIQALLGTYGEGQKLLESRKLAEAEIGIHEKDKTVKKGLAYLPAAAIRFDPVGGEGGTAAYRSRILMPAEPLLARHGLSIIYDPRFDEIIATFPSSHCFMVFDGADGGIKRIVRTRRIGLHFPSGIALLADGEHYAVLGYWRDLYAFRRGAHTLNRAACQYALFFGHSHIAAG